MNDVKTLDCGRAEDLIGFLYGELGDGDARSFKSHLRECGSCQQELTNFGAVREDVVAWRDASLGGLSSAALPVAAPASGDKRSALVALRQFFNVSPLWLKGAVAFASILFCVLAVLAVVRLREHGPAPIVATGEQGYSQQQVRALVERRVQEELQRERNLAGRTAKSVDEVVTVKSIPRLRIRNSRESLASNAAVQKAKRPLSKNEREQLAFDLRLTSARNESDLDLLDDRINQ
ncbi:MAG: hypothetical protein QOD33_1459 [Pyrinomonadaceae bacterium]|nr:hypothetical protein [Pyrinomonadaceae bacterium]